jgi:DNA-binding FadR family transcriptional regulator
MDDHDDKAARSPARRTMTLAGNGSAGSSLLQQLGCEIVRGDYAPEARLPDEATMLERYAVSRTALREAYGKLAAKGMIAARPKVGTSVRPAAHWNMLDADVLGWHLQTMPAGEVARDLYALRRMVEPAAAGMAAEKHTFDDLARIAAAFDAMQATREDEAALIAADLDFHIAILHATRNHFIGAFSALIHAAMMSTFRLSWRGASPPPLRTERLQQHGDILQAIRDSNPALARECMERLLDDAIGDVAGPEGSTTEATSVETGR